jgi:hypothetical protein
MFEQEYGVVIIPIVENPRQNDGIAFDWPRGK